MRYVLKTYIIILSLSWSIIPLSFSQTAEDAEIIANIQWESKQVSEGIIYKKCEAITLFNSLQSIVVVEIDTAIADLQYLLDFSSDYMPVSAFAERNKALVAINGTYFTSTGSSQHFMKIEDVVYFNTLNTEFDTRASGVFTVTDGKVDISTWNREKEAEKGGDAQYALVCGPVLIIEGEFPELWDGEYITQDRHPRSCVGLTDDGKLLIMAIDGRQSGRAQGMDLYELRFFAKELGCINAMNLDGGGSTALYVAGEPKQGIVNVPIDSNISGKERNVGNILYVTAPSSPKPFIHRNNSPGGITGMRMWVKADGDVYKDENNHLIAPYLFDYTGFNVFDMDINKENASIKWIADKQNFHPVLSFDSASVLKSRRKADYSTFFSVNTLNRKGTLLGFDEFGSSYSKFRYYLMADDDNVYVHDGSSQSSGLNYNHIPYKQEFDQGLNIFSSSYGKSKDDFILNGQEQRNEATDFCKRSNITATVQIGARNSYPSYPTTNQYYFRGDVAEIIIYPDTLTPNKHNRVESYLAVKYGITMTNPKYRYLSSYGDSWWSGNVSSYTSYSNYLTCIVRDDKSDLHQPVSKGTGNHTLPYSDALLTLVHGSDPYSPAPITNNQYYLTVGCTLDDVSQYAEMASGVANYQVMKRHWKLNTESESEPFSLIIDIPESLRPLVHKLTAGILVKNSSESVFYTGTVNEEKSKLTIPGISALKGDLLYVVLNDKNHSGIDNVDFNNCINVFYQSEQKKLSINCFSDLNAECHIFSITGEKILSHAFAGSLELPVQELIPGVYIAQVMGESNRILHSKKIIITSY